AAIEVLAKASPAEVLDDHIHRLALVPLIGAPVVDLGDVRMPDRRALFGGKPERPFKTFGGTEIGVHDLDRDDSLVDEIEGVEHRRVDTTAAPGAELVATSHDATVELGSHH